MINTWQVWTAVCVNLKKKKKKSYLKTTLSVLIFVLCSAADLICIPFALGTYHQCTVRTISWKMWANLIQT